MDDAEQPRAYLYEYERRRPLFIPVQHFVVGVYYQKKEDTIELRSVAASTKVGERFARKELCVCLPS